MTFGNDTHTRPRDAINGSRWTMNLSWSVDPKTGIMPDDKVEKNANSNSNEIGGAFAGGSAPLSPNDNDKEAEKQKEKEKK